MLVKDFIAQLQQFHKPDEQIAYIFWQRDDVIGSFKDKYGFEPSIAFCDDVLVDMHDHADCEYGMKWDTLACCIEDMIGEYYHCDDDGTYINHPPMYDDEWEEFMEKNHYQHESAKEEE